MKKYEDYIYQRKEHHNEEATAELRFVAVIDMLNDLASEIEKLNKCKECCAGCENPHEEVTPAFLEEMEKEKKTKNRTPLDDLSCRPLEGNCAYCGDCGPLGEICDCTECHENPKPKCEQECLAHKGERVDGPLGCIECRKEAINPQIIMKLKDL